MAAFWQMMCNALAAFFGVQRDRNGDRYARNGNVPLIIVIGYALTFLIAGVIYLVAWVSVGGAGG